MERVNKKRERFKVSETLLGIETGSLRSGDRDGNTPIQSLRNPFRDWNLPSKEYP